MASNNALTLHDISWLRQASHKTGAASVPPMIAKRLVAGGFVIAGANNCFTITQRGHLALTRLG